MGILLALGLTLACAQATPTPAPTPTTAKTFPTVAPTATATAPAATPTAAATPASGAGDATAGKIVFTAKCDVCHPGGKKGVGADLTGIGTAKSDADILAVIKSGKGAMPAFGSQLGDKELADVLAFLKTLR